VNPPLPAGFHIDVDADTRQIDDTTLFGGAPARFLRLSAAGVRAWRELRTGPVTSPAAGVLARRLTDAGLAHPRPPTAPAPDVTVIIPVRDRADSLARCLDSLGRAHRVIVVDDGSADPGSVAEVAARHGATLLTRPGNGGPAAARNTGLARVTSELVAFLDSDCVAPPGWITALAGHFADPAVAAVAPRVVPVPSTPWASSLDLGDRAARVAPGTRLAYVPTAALLARRAALPDFDPALRYGEDVDLVWRLHAAGWRIRYDPSVHVRHHEPRTWPALLARRFRYGTSAGPLARRHPAAMAPLVLLPWPAITVAGLLTANPVAALGFGAALAANTRTLRRSGLPTTGVVAATWRNVYQTLLGLSRYGTQFAAPLLIAGLCDRRTRTPAAALLLTRPLITYATRRPAIDAIRYTLGSIADDIAYGSGVFSGCVRARTVTPLVPRV
jgi:mycofactocin system glycosyltransferase